MSATVSVIVVAVLGVTWFLSLGNDDTSETDADDTAEAAAESEPEVRGDSDSDPVESQADETEPIEPTTTTDDSTEPTEPTAAPGESTEPSNPDCPAADKSSPRTIDFDGPQPMCIDTAGDYTAVFETSEGEIIFNLDTQNTPNTVNNFVTLARWGYYDETTLFRTDPSIDIIQGGSPHTNSAGDPGPGYTIADEPTFNDEGGNLTGPYRYAPGQLVMARSAGRDSSGAQFFFTTGENTALLDGQGTYIVFGQTDAAGLAVLQDIIALHEPDDSGLGGRPSRTVTVNSVTIQVS